MTVLKGGGGEFERHASKRVELVGLRDGMPTSRTACVRFPDARRLADGAPEPDKLAALWSGDLVDPFAQAVVKGTAAVALWGLGRHDSLAAAEREADALWHIRQCRAAA